MLINALDYATIQDAVAAAQDGDRLYFPGVKTWLVPAGGLVIQRNIEVFGDGPSNPGDATETNLMAQSDNDDVIRPKPGCAARGPYSE